MISFKESNKLLQLPKFVYDNQGDLQKEIIFETTIPIYKKLVLIAFDNDEFSFLYEINQSKKNHLKLSLFLMQNDSKIGLLRVDFSGKHKNPEGIKDNVPPEFIKYAVVLLGYNEPHIHYNVDGYEPMDWAIPLRDTQLKVKNIKDQNDIVSAFFEFNNLINLQDKFSIGSSFLL